jgi:CspA family cold shock protein
MRISRTVELFFNTAKGFGFIEPDDGGKDMVVHATAVEAVGIRALNEGYRVSVELADDKRGSGEQASRLKAFNNPVFASGLQTQTTTPAERSVGGGAVPIGVLTSTVNPSLRLRHQAPPPHGSAGVMIVSRLTDAAGQPGDDHDVPESSDRRP